MYANVFHLQRFCKYLTNLQLIILRLQQVFNSLGYLLDFWYSDGIRLLVSYVLHGCRMPCLPVLLVASMWISKSGLYYSL